MDPWTVVAILGGPLLWAVSVGVAYSKGKEALEDDLRRLEEQAAAANTRAAASDQKRIEQRRRYLGWAAKQGHDAAAMAALERDMAGLDDGALFERVCELADADARLAAPPGKPGAGGDVSGPQEMEGEARPNGG